MPLHLVHDATVQDGQRLGARQGSTALVAPPPIADLLKDDIMAPYRHVASLESKQFRGALVDAFNVWLHLPDTACEEVKHIVEILHNASLIVDDIEDSSNLRRGAPAAHRVFGMPLALNSANTMYFVALEKVVHCLRVVAEDAAQRGTVPPLRFGTSDMATPDVGTNVGHERQLVRSPQAWAQIAAYYRDNASTLTIRMCEAFSTEMIQLHHGQGLDIYWRDMAQCPSLDEYDEMVLKKTGGLFRLAVKLMIALSPVVDMEEGRNASADGALLALVDDIGVLFQTLDDYLNVSSAAYHKNKSFCEDITEGKFSYPVIHCLQEQARCGEKTLLHILRQRPTDDEVKRYCVEMMRKSGSLDACKARILEVQASVQQRIAALGDGEMLLVCIERMMALM